MPDIGFSAPGSSSERSLKVRRLLREQDHEGAIPPALTISRDAKSRYRPGPHPDSESGRWFTAARDSELVHLGHLTSRTWEVHSTFVSRSGCKQSCLDAVPIPNRDRARGSAVATHHFAAGGHLPGTPLVQFHGSIQSARLAKSSWTSARHLETVFVPAGSSNQWFSDAFGRTNCPPQPSWSGFSGLFSPRTALTRCRNEGVSPSCCP
jgi:hypothetical protein